MEYNSKRPDIIIPEYGRNVQRMVEFALSIEDREERNKVVKAIISVMGQLFPYLRDIEDFNHKLWDHLHIMSDFKLDVDSPYPAPNIEELAEKPDRLNYPSGKIRYGHYGKSLQELIKKAKGLEAGEEKEAFVFAIANLMKRQYVTWNRGNVEDEVILSQLKELSGGALHLAEGQSLLAVADIPDVTPIRKKNTGHKKQKKGRQNYRKPM